MCKSHLMNACMFFVVGCMETTAWRIIVSPSTWRMGNKILQLNYSRDSQGTTNDKRAVQYTSLSSTQVHTRELCFYLYWCQLCWKGVEVSQLQLVHAGLETIQMQWIIYIKVSRTYCDHPSETGGDTVCFCLSPCVSVTIVEIWWI